MGLSTIHLVGVDLIEIAELILIIETYFYMILKRNIVAYLQLKHYGVHLHGLDMRDTYTNSIINDNDNDKLYK